MKGLRVTKIAKKLSLKRSGASWKQKNISRDNHLQILLSCEIASYGKGFLFFKSFLLVLTKFWQDDWALRYHSMAFRHFPGTS